MSPIFGTVRHGCASRTAHQPNCAYICAGKLWLTGVSNSIRCYWKIIAQWATVFWHRWPLCWPDNGLSITRFDCDRRWSNNLHIATKQQQQQVLSRMKKKKRRKVFNIRSAINWRERTASATTHSQHKKKTVINCKLKDWKARETEEKNNVLHWAKVIVCDCLMRAQILCLVLLLGCVCAQLSPHQYRECAAYVCVPWTNCS